MLVLLLYRGASPYGSLSAALTTTNGARATPAAMPVLGRAEFTSNSHVSGLGKAVVNGLGNLVSASQSRFSSTTRVLGASLTKSVSALKSLPSAIPLFATSLLGSATKQSGLAVGSIPGRANLKGVSKGQAFGVFLVFQAARQAAQSALRVAITAFPINAMARGATRSGSITNGLYFFLLRAALTGRSKGGAVVKVTLVAYSASVTSITRSSGIAATIVNPGAQLLSATSGVLFGPVFTGYLSSLGTSISTAKGLATGVISNGAARVASMTSGTGFFSRAYAGFAHVIGLSTSRALTFGQIAGSTAAQSVAKGRPSGIAKVYASTLSKASTALSGLPSEAVSGLSKLLSAATGYGLAVGKIPGRGRQTTAASGTPGASLGVAGAALVNSAAKAIVKPLNLIGGMAVTTARASAHSLLTNFLFGFARGKAISQALVASAPKVSAFAKIETQSQASAKGGVFAFLSARLASGSSAGGALGVKEVAQLIARFTMRAVPSIAYATGAFVAIVFDAARYVINVGTAPNKPEQD